MSKQSPHRHAIEAHAMIAPWKQFDEAIARMNEVEKRQLIERVQRSLNEPGTSEVQPGDRIIGNSLDEFIGDWSDDEAEAFEQTVQACRK